jgi:DNA ligase (NAD+)
MHIDDRQAMEYAIECLNNWTDAYDKNIPMVTDAEWDALYLELKAAEKRLGLILPDSPTQKVHYTVVNELKKVKHEYQPMLSLDKTKDIDEIKSFINNKEWIAMLKLDGLTCRLTYEEGKLVRAETRGNGVEGEDITHNAMVLPSIPKRIPYYDTLIVDGEVICDLKTFEQFKNEYANARNFAAGSIRLLDSKECAKRGLTFVAWDIILDADDDEWTKLGSKLMWLYNYGFTTVPYFQGEDFEYFDDIISSLKNIADIEEYPIDGLVFKWNKCKEYEAAGRTDHHFRGGLAYKFYDEEYETELVDIEWTMGRTGVLTPVAIYKDIEIDGAICNRASLHNINTMNELLGYHPYEGQKIWIYKANQIIPQISKSLPQPKDADVSWINIPAICPVCLGAAEVHESDSGTIELYCANDMCSGKLINRLDHFVGKKGLDIKHLSKATLEKLIDWGWVSSAKDIFTLDQHRAEWVKKPGFGEKSVDRLLSSISDARVCSLESYISALGIPLIGRTYAKQLAQAYEDYNTFREVILQGEDFSQLDGFGPAMHEAIITFDYSEADKMFDMGIVDIKNNELPEIGNTPSLEGLTFCITGKLVNYKNRDLLKAEITARGGKVTDSVTSKTSYLVNNDINSTSSKNKKAKELNIPIITEEELIKML